MSNPTPQDLEAARAYASDIGHRNWMTNDKDAGLREGYADGLAAARERTAEARSHLRVALLQVVPSDDEIIMGHMRDALALLGGE